MKKTFASLATISLVAGLTLFGAAEPASAALSDTRTRVLNAHIDERRSKCGTDLKLGNSLNNAAQYHAQDMLSEGYFSHNSANPFEYWYDRIERYTGRSSGIGENIASGYTNTTDVMNAWMNSTSHRANILNCSFDTIGVGYVSNGSSTRWVVDFGV